MRNKKKLLKLSDVYSTRDSINRKTITTIRIMVNFRSHSIKIKDFTIKIQCKIKDREMRYVDAKNNFQAKFSVVNVTNATLKFVKVASIFVPIVEYLCALIVNQLALSVVCVNVNVVTAIV